jgi:hypothetical protein
MPNLTTCAATPKTILFRRHLSVSTIDKGGCSVPVVDRESMQNHTLLLVVARQHGENLAGHCWEVEIAAMMAWESSYVEMWARCHSLIPYDRLEENSSWRTPTVLRTENLSCR